MKKGIITFIVMIIFIGCSDKNTNLSKTIENEIVGSKYNYYGYDLFVSEDLKAKLYTWTNTDFDINSVNDNKLFHKIPGKIKDEKFIISEKNRPIHFKKFNNLVEVKKIKFKPNDSFFLANLNSIKDSKGVEEKLVNSILDPLINSFKDIKDYEPIEIGYSDDKNDHYKVINLSKHQKNENGEYIIDNPFKTIKNVQEAQLVISSLKLPHKNKSKEAYYSKSEVLFYIKDLSVENDIVRQNLKNMSNNEELVKIIAKNNPDFFRTLQNERSNYTLDEKSILRLPTDADINYALNNLTEIINSSEYLSVNNSFKKINISSVFPNVQKSNNLSVDNNFEYKSTKRDTIKNDNKTLNLSNEDFKENKKKKVDFVDLDNGI